MKGEIDLKKIEIEQIEGTIIYLRGMFMWLCWIVWCIDLGWIMCYYRSFDDRKKESSSRDEKDDREKEQRKRREQEEQKKIIEAQKRQMEADEKGYSV